MKNKIIIALLFILVLFPLSLKAQQGTADGSVPATTGTDIPPTPPTTDPVPAPATGAASATPDSASSSQATPTAGTSGSTGSPQTTTSATSTPKPKPAVVKPTLPVVEPVVIDTIPSVTPENTTKGSSKNIIIIAISAVVLGILTFFGLNFKKKKTEDKKEDKKCFNIKKLMEEKLEELKDWEGQLKGIAKDKAKQQVKKAIKGTSAEKLLTLVENGKKEYERLEKLYEKCITDLPKNKIEIIFEAHGTTFDNEANVTSGHNDVALSPLGEQQSKEMGERYKNDKFDVIFCSDLERAYKSAEIAFGDKFKTVKDARLRECNYGDFTQKPSEIVNKEKLNRINTPFPNGESYKETTERMKSFLEDIKKDYKGKKIMIIGHRATQYGLENIINKKPLEEIVPTKFIWQSGWKYDYENF